MGLAYNLDEVPLCNCGCGKKATWSSRHNEWNTFLVGHSVGNKSRIKLDLSKGEAPCCACGCGKKVNWNKWRKKWVKYCSGHSGTKTLERKKILLNGPPDCACGCGEKVGWAKWRKRWNNYVDGHQSRIWTIKKARELAKSKKGKLLSNSIKNNKEKLEWKCVDKNHPSWFTTINSIYSGNWCQECFWKSRRVKFEDIKKIIIKKGGILLSSNFLNIRSKLLIQCNNKNHPPWEIRVNEIKKGIWCRKCFWDRIKPSIGELKSLAIKNSGILLSNKYVNNTDKLTWKCEKGHIFKMSYSNVKDKQRWCQVCSWARIKPSMEKLNALAKNHNGILISNSYKNRRTNLIWQCKKGHIFHAKYNNVNRGTWCPQCSLFKSERLCREHFRNILKRRFPKTHPKWLEGLELDGYSRSLKLAFEYQGKQHYESVTFGNMSKKKAQMNLEYVKEHDARKRILCAQNGIILIEIPYTWDGTEEYVRNAIMEACPDLLTNPIPIDHTQMEIDTYIAI